MSFVLIIFILSTGDIFGQCTPVFIHQELKSQYGYLPQKVSGLEQDNIIEVINFIESVANETGRDSVEIVKFLRGTNIPGDDISRNALESRIQSYFSEFKPQRASDVKVHSKFAELSRLFGNHLENMSPDFLLKVMDGNIKNGRKYIKFLKDFDPVMARVLSNFILQANGVISEKAILKILKAVKKKGLSPVDFITLITPERLELIKRTTKSRLGVFESSPELNSLIADISNSSISSGPLRIGIDPSVSGERMRMTPGFFTDEVGLGYRGGTRQEFNFDIPAPPFKGNFLLKIDRGSSGRVNGVNFIDDKGVNHYLPTPEHIIELYGDRVTDSFFGMRKVEHQRYSYGDAEELNANIKAFNETVGDDSPLRIDSHFYYSAPINGENPLALSSQRTIDRLANGFGWPMGSRDVYQIHDLGAHSSLMLADRKLIQASQQKARDVIGLRDVISKLDISKELKDEIIFSINQEAGELFENIGVVMNGVMNGDYTLPSLDITNLSQRDFILKIKRNIKGGSMPNVTDAITKYARSLPSSPVGLTGEKLREVAEKKLSVIRANF